MRNPCLDVDFNYLNYVGDPDCVIDCVPLNCGKLLPREAENLLRGVGSSRQALKVNPRLRVDEGCQLPQRFFWDKHLEAPKVPDNVSNLLQGGPRSGTLYISRRDPTQGLLKVGCGPNEKLNKKIDDGDTQLPKFHGVMYRFVKVIQRDDPKKKPHPGKDDLLERVEHLEATVKDLQTTVKDLQTQLHPHAVADLDRLLGQVSVPARRTR